MPEESRVMKAVLAALKKAEKAARKAKKDIVHNDCGEFRVKLDAAIAVLSKARTYGLPE